MIEELQSRLRQAVESWANGESSDDSQNNPINRAVTDFTNHRHLMNYPKYRKQGLPLTSSHTLNNFWSRWLKNQYGTNTY